MKSSSNELQVAASEPTHEKSEHLARQEEDEYFLAQSRNLAGHIDWRNQYSIRTEGSRQTWVIDRNIGSQTRNGKAGGVCKMGYASSGRGRGPEGWGDNGCR
jgi:hypothetical protein